jgi:hypothetical protein
MVRGMDYTSIQELELFIEKCYRSGNLAPEDALDLFYRHNLAEQKVGREQDGPKR